MPRLEERDEEQHKKLMKVFKLLFIGIILFFLSIFFQFIGLKKIADVIFFILPILFFINYFNTLSYFLLYAKNFIKKWKN